MKLTPLFPVRAQQTSRRLLVFARPYWKEISLSVLLSVATTAASIGLMGTSAYLIATAALQPSIAVLQVAIVGVRAFGIARGVFRYLERLVSHSVNFKLLAQLRGWFFRAVEPLVPGGVEDLQVRRSTGQCHTGYRNSGRFLCPRNGTPALCGDRYSGDQPVHHAIFAQSGRPAGGWIDPDRSGSFPAGAVT